MSDLPIPVSVEEKARNLAHRRFKAYLRQNWCLTKFYAKMKQHRDEGLEKEEAWKLALADFGLDWQKPPTPAKPEVTEDAKPAPVRKAVSPKAVKGEGIAGRRRCRKRANNPSKEIPDDEMAESKAWAGKPRTDDARVIVQWVFENMRVQDVKPEDAPCGGAWALLMECRGDAGIRQDFYKSIWPKLLPTKQQIQTESLSADDGHEITLDLIDRVKAARDKADKSAPKQIPPEPKVVAIGTMGNTVQ